MLLLSFLSETAQQKNQSDNQHCNGYRNPDNKDHNYRVESYIMHNIHIYTDDEMSFSYNANTKEITCHSKKCPNDAYEDIKDYLEIYNSLWN